MSMYIYTYTHAKKMTQTYHTNPLDISQKSHRNPIDSRQKCHRNPMIEIPWNYHRNHKEIPQESHRNPIDIPWKSHRNIIETPQKIHRNPKKQQKHHRPQEKMPGELNQRKATVKERIRGFCFCCLLTPEKVGHNRGPFQQMY